MALSKSRVSAERKFAQSGYAEDDYKEFLDFIITENEEISLNRAKSVIQAIERASDKKLKDKMKNIDLPENSESKIEEKKDEEIAKNLGKTRSESHKTAMDTLKKYIGGF